MCTFNVWQDTLCIFPHVKKTDPKIAAGKFSQQPVIWTVSDGVPVTAVQSPTPASPSRWDTLHCVFSGGSKEEPAWQVRPEVRAETQHCNWQRSLTAAMCAGMLTSWFSNGDIKFYSRAGALSLPSMFGSLWQQVCFSHGRTVGGARAEPAGEPKSSRPDRMWRRSCDHNKVRWANKKFTCFDFWGQSQGNLFLCLCVHSESFKTTVVLHMCAFKCI